MTAILRHLAPHLLDPLETTKAAERYFANYGRQFLERRIAEQQRAIEHEQAILSGMKAALANVERRQQE